MSRHRITKEASKKGTARRHQRSVLLHFDLYNELRVIAREEGIAPTLAGIAEQLNRRGLLTNRGRPFDFRKVGAALDRLGVDRRSIERWKEHARLKAHEWHVPWVELRKQLWIEWQRHVATSRDPFIPNLRHPEEWDALENAREPDVRLMHPPPEARIVHLFLGAFDEPE